jgi:hypothetical protein
MFWGFNGSSPAVMQRENKFEIRSTKKESRYWLKLIDTEDRKDLERDRTELIREATELMNIFGAILRKSE